MLMGMSPSDDSLTDQDSSNVPSEEKLRLRDEISCMVEKLNYELPDTDLIAPERVNFTFESFLLFIASLRTNHLLL